MPFGRLFFVAIALLLYFSTREGSRHYFLPFLVFTGTAAFLPPFTWVSILLFVVAYLLFGMKDIVFLQRRKAYRWFSYFLLVAAVINIFSRFDSWEGEGSGTYGLIAPSLLAAFFYILLSSDAFFRADEEDIAHRRGKKIVIGCAAFMLWQIGLAVFFLPISFVWQTILIAAVIGFLLQVLPDYFEGSLSRERLLTAFSILFVCVVAVVTTQQWELHAIK